MKWKIYQHEKPNRDERVLVWWCDCIYSARYVLEQINMASKLEWFFVVDELNRDQILRYSGHGRISADIIEFWSPFPNQPERSKREDKLRAQDRCIKCNQELEVFLSTDEPRYWKDCCGDKSCATYKNIHYNSSPLMRCSEHCGDTVRRVQ